MFITKIASVMPAMKLSAPAKSSHINFSGSKNEDVVKLSPEAKAYNTLHKYYSDLENDCDPDYEGIVDLEKQFPEQAQLAKAKVQEEMLIVNTFEPFADEDKIPQKGAEKEAFDELYGYYSRLYNDNDPDYEGIVDLEKQFPSEAALALAKAKHEMR